MKKNGIAVIGRMADGVQLLDGQTVKTRILRDELRRAFPGRELVCVDTYRYSRRILPVLWQTLRAFLRCEHIFVLLSRNGRRFLFPLLTGLNRLFHRRLYHDVIGGALPEEVRRRPALGRQLRRFEVNWVEFAGMQQALARLGVSNTEVLPNFKRLRVLAEEELPPARQAPFVFVMFSRVMKEKGVGEAAAAVAAANRCGGGRRAVLHVYGPVEPAYQAEFDALLRQHPDEVFYRGCVPYEESVQALCSGFMLLFPSTYSGEGLPGTIIDAFSAGLPVIATDWHFNAELVRSGETGYCYPWQEPEKLAEWVCHAVDHPEQIEAMRPACLQAAARYTPEAAMARICGRMARPPQETVT